MPVPISYFLVGVGLLVVIVDQLTKGWVSTHLPLVNPSHYWYPYGGIGIFQDIGGIEFSINHMTNTGAAWGIFEHYQLPLILVRIALILGLFIYLLYFNSHRSWVFPLVLIISGAIANVIDYFVYGHVIDMLHFVLWGYDFPVFNVADSAISIGIIWLFLVSSFKKSHAS